MAKKPITDEERREVEELLKLPVRERETKMRKWGTHYKWSRLMETLSKEEEASD